MDFLLTHNPLQYLTNFYQLIVNHKKSFVIIFIVLGFCFLYEKYCFINLQNVNDNVNDNVNVNNVNIKHEKIFMNFF